MKRNNQLRHNSFFLSLFLTLAVGCVKNDSSINSTAPTQDPLVTADTEFLYKRGMALRSRGEYVASDDYLKAAMAKGMPEKKVIPQLVDNAIRSNRYRMALEYLKPLLDKEPNHWHLRFLSGTLRLGLKDYDLAETELKRVIQLAPKEGEPHYVLAHLYSEQWGKSKLARKHFLEYIDLVPEGTKTVVARRWLHENQQSADSDTKGNAL